MKWTRLRIIGRDPSVPPRPSNQRPWCPNLSRPSQTPRRPRSTPSSHRHHCPCRLLRHLSCHSLVWLRRRSILSSWSRHCQPSPSAPPAAAPPATRAAAPGVPPYHHQWDTFCCFCEWKNKVMEQMKITKIEISKLLIDNLNSWTEAFLQQFMMIAQRPFWWHYWYLDNIYENTKSGDIYPTRECYFPDNSVKYL